MPVHYLFTSLTAGYGYFLLYLQCWAQVQLAFAAVEAELIAGNFSQLAADFSCCQIPQNLDDQVKENVFNSTLQQVD